MSLEDPKTRHRHVTDHQAASQEANSVLEHLCKLDIYSDPKEHRLTSIICTLGPASKSEEVLTQLVNSGMNIVRLNFSHGTHEYHAETIASVRKVLSKFRKSLSVAIALDTKGPEIRLGLLKGGGSAEVELKRGNRVTLTTDESKKQSGTADCIFVDYKNIVKVVELGGTIYVDDGLISLTVKEKGSDFLVCEIENGGMLGSRKGVNLPHADVDLPAVSEQDKKDLLFGVEQDVDMVFASFIRKADDVKEVRAVLGEKGKNILVISKIENHEGMRNFNEVLAASDGIMVARGDLGIEIPAQKVFLAQKMMVGRCIRAGKPVICATQMLDSMINNPRPTRAEGSDVANAVLDGVDCIMLSGETAKGKYPVQAVEMMHNISTEAESAMFHRLVFDEIKLQSSSNQDMMRAVAIAAVSASFECNAGAIICLTKTGKSPKTLSNYRPHAGILTVTRDARVARQIHLWRGCFSLYYDQPVVEPWEEDVEARVKWAISKGKEFGILSKGSPVVVVQGFRPGPYSTNTIRILTCD